MQQNLSEILSEVAKGKLSPSDAEKQLVALNRGFANLGHTRLDIDRTRRRGIPEAVFCHGKTPQQVLDIALRLDSHGQTVLCTRVLPETADFVINAEKQFQYNPVGRILYKINEQPPSGHGVIAVLTAGTTDIPVAEEAALCAEVWGNQVTRIFDVGVAGLHRLLDTQKALEAATVIIVAAGMEGALPSVVAGLVRAPVIALPTSVGYGASFGGITAMLGMLTSCSGGIATVNIDNGFGAALLAHMINHVGIAAPPAGS